jgi:hypothetical protein
MSRLVPQAAIPAGTLIRALDGKLDCFYCGRLFDDFDKLARHTTDEHFSRKAFPKKEFDCFFCPVSVDTFDELKGHMVSQHRAVLTSHTGRTVEEEDESQQTSFFDSPKEKKPMKETLEKSGSGGGDFKRRAFLRASDLPKNGKVVIARVIEFREAPKGMDFSDYLLDISIGSKEFVIGLKEGWKLDKLIDLLGPKPAKWAGKTFPLHQGEWKQGKKITPVVRFGKE